MRTLFVEDSIRRTSLRQDYGLQANRGEANTQRRAPTPNVKSERSNVRLLTQARDPAFLNLLRFVLDQFLFNIASRFRE